MKTQGEIKGRKSIPQKPKSQTKKTKSSRIVESDISFFPPYICLYFTVHVSYELWVELVFGRMTTCVCSKKNHKLCVRVPVIRSSVL